MRRGLLHLRSPHLCLDAMNIPEIDTTAMEPTRGSERKGMRLVGLLALVTLVFFGLGGAWLIVGVQGRELAPVLVGPSGLWWQIFLGIASGLAIGYSAWALISRPFMETVLMKYAMLIGPLMPGATARILVSLCAGVGEEVFFRGAIQHWLGIVWTALASAGFTVDSDLALGGCRSTSAFSSSPWRGWGGRQVRTACTHRLSR